MPSSVLFLQLLSQGSTDVPMLQAEVTEEREAAVATEAVRVMAVLAAETSAQEVAAA
jgi:hypothetical protein